MTDACETLTLMAMTTMLTFYGYKDRGLPDNLYQVRATEEAVAYFASIFPDTIYFESGVEALS